MEGSASAPAKKGMSMKVIAIVVVAVLLIAAVGAAILLMGSGSSKKADNWLDQGFNLEVFYNSGNTARQTACEVIKAGLESLNPGKIKITVTALEWSKYLEYRKTSKMPAMFLGWAPDYADPDDYVQPFYLSGGTYASMVNYNNATLDDKIMAAAAELDTTERAAMYKEISMDMQKECVFIYTAQATNFAVMRDWVEGYYFNPMYSNLYYYSMNINQTSSSDHKDTYVYATIGGEPESLDPAVGYETVGGELMQNVLEMLIWYNGSSSSELVPMLATEVPTVANGGISADGLTYTFHIRDGVKFSNGNTLTAQDVKYTFDRGLMYNYAGGPFWMYGQVLVDDYYSYGQAVFNETTGAMESEITQAMCDAHIWAVDDSTVQFNLTQAYPAFLAALAYNAGGVVDQQWCEANGGYTKDGFDYVATHMMGTGPYTLQSVTPEVGSILKRNDNYWRTPAAIENVVISQVPEVNTRVTGILNGEYDGAAIPRVNRASVEGQPGIAVVKGNPTFNIDFLGLNQKLNVTGNNPEKTNVPADFFADRNVRLAFAHAFNYGTYINNTLQGMAIQPNGAIPMGMFGYDASVPVHTYDKDKAAAYLKAAKLPTTSDSAPVDVLAEISTAVVREL